MPPPLMAFLFVVGIIGLFVFDRDDTSQTSNALWIPTAWLFLNCSRPVSLWLYAIGLRGLLPTANTTEIYLEGSPVDGAVFSILLISGFIVLAHRVPQVGPLLGRMIPILLFFTYCAISILWAEYPFVAFKHWNKGIGDIVMVLIILTDPDPFVALKRLFSRIGFVVVPLSVLFIKYYPALGRGFTVSGFPMYTGVTMQKNTLGVICLIFGLGSLWRFLAVYRDRAVARRKKLLVAHGTVLVMVAWLLYMCNSMTSISCFVMASGLLVLASRPTIARRMLVVHLLVAAMIGISVFALFFDSGGGILQDLGRNPTLTGRTAIWEAVLPLAGNPLVGTGYESFWLGKRLENFWTINDGAFKGIQEAHNGYLELFLNLGWIGIVLLAVLILTSYPRVIATYRSDPYAGSLGVAFFASELVYNFTEAGFRMMFPLWIFFLLAVMGVPKTPVPQSFSAIDGDLGDDLAVVESDFDHALDAMFREEIS
jgi:O-antigen ligase